MLCKNQVSTMPTRLIRFQDVSLLFLITLSIFFFGCKKSPQNAKSSTAVNTGSNTEPLSVELDGKKQNVLSLSSEIVKVYSCDRFYIRITAKLEKGSLSMWFRPDITPGTYSSANLADGGPYELHYLDNNSPPEGYSPTNGNLNLTRHDLISKLIEGKFSHEIKYPDDLNGDKWHQITNGSIRINY